MKEAKTKSKNELLPGTPEMLILKTLSMEPMHGNGIAQHIQMVSEHVLTIERGIAVSGAAADARDGW